jgi:hypothetical protein
MCICAYVWKHACRHTTISHSHTDSRFRRLEFVHACIHTYLGIAHIQTYARRFTASCGYRHPVFIHTCAHTHIHTGSQLPEGLEIWDYMSCASANMGFIMCVIDRLEHGTMFSKCRLYLSKKGICTKRCEHISDRCILVLECKIQPVFIVGKNPSL